MQTVTAKIATAEGASYEIHCTGNSYWVPGISHTTKGGAVRTTRGCRDEREAFRVAKKLAKQNGRGVSSWRLRLL